MAWPAVAASAATPFQAIIIIPLVPLLNELLGLAFFCNPFVASQQLFGPFDGEAS